VPEVVAAAGHHRRGKPQAKPGAGRTPSHAGFEGVEVDTRRRRRDEAVGVHPSTGAAPQALPHQGQDSPSTTAAIEGSSSLVPPPTLHKTHSLFCLLETKDRHTCHLPEMTRKPGQDSCTSDIVGQHLHALVDGTGATRRRDGDDHGRTLFHTDDVAAAASATSPET